MLVSGVFYLHTEEFSIVNACCIFSTCCAKYRCIESIRHRCTRNEPSTPGKKTQINPEL